MNTHKVGASALFLGFAFAAPGIVSADVVEVEYWGQPLMAEPLPPVRGTLLIDLLLAPPDSDLSNRRGDYAWPDVAKAPGGFVVADVLRDGAETSDRVIVEDGFGRGRLGEDLFFARDREFFVDGRPDLYSVSVSARGLFDFINGDDIPQSFDVEPSSDSLGVLESLVDGVGSYILFAVTRLRATPVRVCKP